MQYNTKEKHDEVYLLTNKYYREYFTHHIPQVILILNNKTINEMDDGDKEKINLNMLINTLSQLAKLHDYHLSSFSETHENGYCLMFKKIK